MNAYEAIKEDLCKPWVRGYGYIGIEVSARILWRATLVNSLGVLDIVYLLSVKVNHQGSAPYLISTALIYGITTLATISNEKKLKETMSSYN